MSPSNQFRTSIFIIKPFPNEPIFGRITNAIRDDFLHISREQSTQIRKSSTIVLGPVLYPYHKICFKHWVFPYIPIKLLHWQWRQRSPINDVDEIRSHIESTWCYFRCTFSFERWIIVEFGSQIFVSYLLRCRSEYDFFCFLRTFLVWTTIFTWTRSAWRMTRGITTTLDDVSCIYMKSRSSLRLRWLRWHWLNWIFMHRYCFDQCQLKLSRIQPVINFGYLITNIL